VARKDFIRKRLHDDGYTYKEYKTLPDPKRRYYCDKLKSAFISGFFEYTRDGDWMEEAVGNQDEWIKIEGMAAWHVNGALAALKKSSDGIASLTPLPEEY
jgi:hypothetical protein